MGSPEIDHRNVGRDDLQTVLQIQVRHKRNLSPNTSKQRNLNFSGRTVTRYRCFTLKWDSNNKRFGLSEECEAVTSLGIQSRRHLRCGHSLLRTELVEQVNRLVRHLPSPEPLPVESDPGEKKKEQISQNGSKNSGNLKNAPHCDETPHNVDGGQEAAQQSESGPFPQPVLYVRLGADRAEIDRPDAQRSEQQKTENVSAESRGTVVGTPRLQPL